MAFNDEVIYVIDKNGKLIEIYKKHKHEVIGVMLNYGKWCVFLTK